MSRSRILFLLALAVAFTGWLTLRKSPSAAAAPTAYTVAEYGENTEEIAMQRWQNNEARHWRQTVTRK